MFAAQCPLTSIIWVATAIFLTIPISLRADIYRWDNGQLIPGTEGITPGPGVQLDQRELEYAALQQLDLTGANFVASNLADADMSYTTLTDADLTGAMLIGANLANARLAYSTLTDANLTGAVVTGINFRENAFDGGARGFTKEQLYSTASYQQKNLQGITFSPQTDLTDWDFSGQNLTDARLEYLTLTNANLAGADLTDARLNDSTLTNANLTGAVITGVGFTLNTFRGLTEEQFYSTSSYQQKNLQGISFWMEDLSGWDFSGQDLTGASLYEVVLTDVNLSGANLTDAALHTIVLTNADLTGAVITGARLSSSSLTNANLSGANLTHTNLRNATLTGADLTEADLTSADMWDSMLTDANLTGANLTNANLRRANLSGAELTGATVTQANLYAVRGFVKEQLYATASYQAKDLQGIVLRDNDLTGWDFSGQNLTEVGLRRSTLTNVDLTGATVTGADFRDTTSRGFAKEQLYATASYQAKDLQGIVLEDNDLTGWDFSGQNLTDAVLRGSTLTNVDLTGAKVTGADFRDTTSRGLTKEMLYSTASYQDKNLQGIKFWQDDLIDWDLSRQNLREADLSRSTLTNANLAGADLTHADLDRSLLTTADLMGADLTNAELQNSVIKNTNLDEVVGLGPATPVYNQWTVFPDGFDPIEMGFTLVLSPTGDLDADDVLDAADVDYLADRIRGGSPLGYWLDDAIFDVNSDSLVDTEDLRVWVKELKHTWFGDANLDGVFNSNDLIQVLQAGEYEDKIAANSTWKSGDWNGDGEFTSDDLTLALQDGGYRQGPRAAMNAIPEPSGFVLLAISMLMVARCDFNGKRRSCWF